MRTIWPKSVSLETSKNVQKLKRAFIKNVPSPNWNKQKQRKDYTTWSRNQNIKHEIIWFLISSKPSNAQMLGFFKKRWVRTKSQLFPLPTLHHVSLLLPKTMSRHLKICNSRGKLQMPVPWTLKIQTFLTDCCLDESKAHWLGYCIGVT